MTKHQFVADFPLCSGSDEHLMDPLMSVCLPSLQQQCKHCYNIMNWGICLSHVIVRGVMWGAPLEFQCTLKSNLSNLVSKQQWRYTQNVTTYNVEEYVSSPCEILSLNILIIRVKDSVMQNSCKTEQSLQCEHGYKGRNAGSSNSQGIYVIDLRESANVVSLDKQEETVKFQAINSF